MLYLLLIDGSISKGLITPFDVTPACLVREAELPKVGLVSNCWFWFSQFLQPD